LTLVWFYSKCLVVIIQELCRMIGENLNFSSELLIKDTPSMTSLIRPK
jgi:hypothetical protein